MNRFTSCSAVYWHKSLLYLPSTELASRDKGADKQNMTWRCGKLHKSHIFIRWIHKDPVWQMLWELSFSFFFLIRSKRVTLLKTSSTSCTLYHHMSSGRMTTGCILRTQGYNTAAVRMQSNEHKWTQQQEKTSRFNKRIPPFPLWFTSITIIIHATLLHPTIFSLLFHLLSRFYHPASIHSAVIL